jgi:hypothetical protein
MLWCIAGCEPVEIIPEREVEVRPDIGRIDIEPSTVDFGLVVLGERVAAETTIVNDSDDAIQLKDLAITPAGEAVSLASATHNDIAYGVWLEPGDAYTVPVFFEAQAAGMYQGDLMFVLPSDVRLAVRVIGEATAP